MAQILSNERLEYTGEVQPQPGELDPSGQPLYPYLPREDLVEAVNLAIQLERPLLLKGEPGCGKTKLARAVAYELGLPFEAWYVKSTSRARDGLYIYDTVGRLRDAQLAAAGSLPPNEDLEKIRNPATYIQWGPLGNAFLSDRRTVVLIDEIDKADIDFPNDLLLELDESRFFVEETRPRREIRAKAPPIVLITSNDEKALPDAFLRRCLFHYLEFPEDKHLKDIVRAMFPQVSQELQEKAVARFLKLRREMQQQKGNAGKKVSTSELIDWIDILRRHPEDEILAKLEGKLPFPGILLKSWEDHRRYLARLDSRS